MLDYVAPRNNLIMNKIFLFASCLLLVLFSSCKKEKNGEIPYEGPSPVSRPEGDPTGALQSFQIGAQGGEFTSADGKLKVIIPAGAVSETINFQVQPITNTADAGVGGGYRLFPHDLNFAKPVILQFNYQALMDSLASEDVLSIAYQSDDGIWHMVRPHNLDKVNKTIQTPTTHFSDWVLVTWLKLTPSSAELNTSEELSLSVLNFHPYSDDLLAPLVSSDNSTLPLGEGTPVPASLIKKWQLTGPGKLSGSGNKGNYTAPATAAAETSATVVVELKSKAHQLLLLSNIKILGEGIRYRYGNGEWRTIPGHVGATIGNQSGLAGEDEEDVLTIIWNGTSGTHSWNYEGGSVAMTITNQLLSKYYVAFVENNIGEIVNSGGNITIDNWGPVGTLVTGRFTVSPSGLRSGLSGRQIGTEAIEGTFRVKRIK